MKTYEVGLKHSYQMRNIANCARMEGKMEGMEERSKQFAIKLYKVYKIITHIVFVK